MCGWLGSKEIISVFSHPRIMYNRKMKNHRCSNMPIFDCEQVWLFSANGYLVYNRGSTTACSCGDLSTNKSANSFWDHCCTTDLCNNLQIPANVTTLASLEQCYLGMTPTECSSAPFVHSYYVII